MCILVISIILWSCGGSGGDNPMQTIPIENNEPTIPILLHPVNNTLCIDNQVEFKWAAATDADGDIITYEIQIAKDIQFNQIPYVFKGTALSKVVSLEKGIAYYWRVKSIDSNKASSSYSSIYNLYTKGEGEINYLPFSPILVRPDLNTVIQENIAILEWSASDVNGNNNLSFDVYFGTNNPPTQKLSENQVSKILSVNLSSSTNYYWKVVVKDGQGSETIGQIWNFITD